MNDENSSTDPRKLVDYLEDLINKYKDKVQCGVVFKLNEDEYPLELLKVLNLIKDKLQKWGNTNIYTYSGKAFKKSKIIVIGTDSLDHALDLIMLVFLTEISKTNDLEPLSVHKEKFEEYYKSEFRSKIDIGYPWDIMIETTIKNHIDKILKDL